MCITSVTGLSHYFHLNWISVAFLYKYIYTLKKKFSSIRPFSRNKSQRKVLFVFPGVGLLAIHGVFSLGYYLMCFVLVSECALHRSSVRSHFVFHCHVAITTFFFFFSSFCLSFSFFLLNI